jgi:porin
MGVRLMKASVTRLSKGLAITPSVQLLLDPALNPQEDTIWVWGLRFRLNL